MDHNDRFYYQTYRCDRCNHSDIRKLKVNRFFSFLQRFRNKNRRLFENAIPPSSATINRLAAGPGYRWESIESALSSTTATSFAFVSAYHLPRDSDSRIRDTDEDVPNSCASYGGYSYLQQKYNLRGYDATLRDKDRKRLIRNSLVDSEHVEVSLLERCDSYPAISPPVRRDPRITKDIVPKSHCHRPGKRKAPPPPISKPSTAPPVTLKRIHRRKKGRAPLPPSKSAMEKIGAEAEDRRQEAVVHNDSLKLEKGMLKANKTQTETYRPETTNTSVSPKHWYKRSTGRPSKNAKSLERKKSCAELLDEWMLEVGQPRSLSFHEFCRLKYSPTNESSKRKSQISMLANISELDREAGEILQRERLKAEQSVSRNEKKYYESSSSQKMDQAVIATEIKRNTSKRGTSVSKEAPMVDEASCRPKENSIKRNLIDDSYNMVDVPKEQQTDTISVKSKPPAKQAFSFPSSKPFSSWTCSQCTLENPSWKFICEACHKWRSSTVKNLNSISETVTNDGRHIIRKFDDLFSRKPITEIKNDSDVDKISKSQNQVGISYNKTSESSSFSQKVFQPLARSRNQQKLETETKILCEDGVTKKTENEEAPKIKPLNFDDENQKKSHFYTEKDRKTFREILRELKDLFPEESLQNHRSAKPKTTNGLVPFSHEGEAANGIQKDEERKKSKMRNDTQASENEKSETSPNVKGNDLSSPKLKEKENDLEKIIFKMENESDKGKIFELQETIKNCQREFEFATTEAEVSLDQTSSTTPENGKENETNEELPDNKLEDAIQRSETMEQPSEDKSWMCLHCTLINTKSKENCEVCDRRRFENVTNNLQPLSGENLTETTKKDLTNYLELVDLEQTDLITNTENFDCPICFASHNTGHGVVLKNCLHTFCRECLSLTIEHSDEVEIKCPYRDADYSCESTLQEREIKALVGPQVFEKYLARSVSEAENKIKNAFHCKTANCRGWCIYEDNVNEFHCPVCFKVNCLTCQTIHTGLNCKQYQEVINSESETNADASRTKLMLQEMLQKEDAMMCPTCNVILMKKWGCDWLRCTMCKTEICWVTRGPRWGPQGKGDTSGGCRCGVHGIKCHEKCTFCH